MPKRLVHSFRYASEGVYTGFRDLKLQLYLLLMAFYIFLGFYYQITDLEWIIILIVSGLVISIELLNTAIEEIVNSLVREHHPSAKIAKDVAAGATLVIFIISLLVNFIVFLPYFS